MAAIERAATIQELADRVGAKLDIVVNESSTPGMGQICSWLNEAAMLLARLLPPGRLGSLRAGEISASDVGETYSLTGTDMLRIVTAKKYGVECRKLDERRMDRITTMFPLLHTTRNPAYCVSGDSGDVEVRFWPSSPGPIVLRGIRRPSKYHNEVDESGNYTYSPDAYSLSAGLEAAAVDYAVLQGKVQDEEPQQVQLLYQMWVQQLGIETKVDALGVD